MTVNLEVGKIKLWRFKVNVIQHQWNINKKAFPTHQATLNPAYWNIVVQQNETQPIYCICYLFRLITKRNISVTFVYVINIEVKIHVYVCWKHCLKYQ